MGSLATELSGSPGFQKFVHRDRWMREVADKDETAGGAGNRAGPDPAKNFLDQSAIWAIKMFHARLYNIGGVDGYYPSVFPRLLPAGGSR